MRHRDGPTQRIERLAQITLVGGLLVGCWFVLAPFLTAILFAVVIAVSTWPLFEWLLARTGGRRGWASLLACLAIVFTIVGPAAVLVASAGDATGELVKFVQAKWNQGSTEPPAWVRSIPVVGESAAGYWASVAASTAEQAALLARAASSAGNLAPFVAGLFADGLKQVVQLLSSVFLLFFVYRDGERMGDWVLTAGERIAGPTAKELIGVAQNTVRGVMLGMVGTAVAQGVVAGIGFAIAGVPGAILLGAATFVLSLVPFGPPIVWVGASVYLYSTSQTGWAIFMALYGALVISSVDNFIKPLLIARSSSLPLVLTLLGVLGGVVAFGFMGLFIGPTLLAVAVNMADRWLTRQAAGPMPSAGVAPPAEETPSDGDAQVTPPSPQSMQVTVIEVESVAPRSGD